ncbi:MAG: TIGR04255 family protein [Gemmatimonadetes bacterium]|nr:TIGR04255 family protein [Gemmatimonadota bacterium]
MARVRHLPRAPIAEAIVDFRVKAAPGFQAERLREPIARLRDRFPNVEERRGMRASFGPFGIASASKARELGGNVQDLGLQGFFCRSQDAKTIVQFRNDGFTYNRLQPYTSWDEIRPEALSLWTLYTEVARPEVVVRVALRYINRLQFPLPIENTARYLTAGPSVPPDLPVEISSFLLRTVLEDSARDVTTNLVQASEQNLDPRVLSVILDIDSFKSKESGFRPDEIAPTLETLHDVKNMVFFSSLTEEILENYE